MSGSLGFGGNPVMLLLLKKAAASVCTARKAFEQSSRIGVQFEVNLQSGAWKSQLLKGLREIACAGGLA